MKYRISRQASSQVLRFGGSQDFTGKYFFITCFNKKISGRNKFVGTLPPNAPPWLRQKRRQKVFNTRALRFFGGAWHSKNWQNYTDLSCSVFQFWGAKPTKAPQWRRDCLEPLLP